MDEKLEALFSLSRDPMLASEGRKLVGCNSPAAELIPGLSPGKSLTGLLPEEILAERSERFTASVTVSGREYVLSCMKADSLRVYALMPLEEPRGPGFLSDGLLSALLSAQCVAGLATERVTGILERRGVTGMEQELSALRRSQFALRRQVTNLDLAVRLWENRAVLMPRRTDITDLTRELAKTVSELRGPEMPHISYQGEARELWVQGEQEKLRRMLLNLISNALEHTPPEGELRLRVSHQGKNAIVTVADNGEGIPPETLRTVFARFQRPADRNHIDRAATAGLGLYVASGVAKLHGGALVIDSRPGQGTTVRVMLPLEPPENISLGAEDHELPGGVDLILTELSGLLPVERYSARYLD